LPSELIKQLLKAGVHFGHQTKRWNPKMKKYIFGHKSGVYIIDLEKTVEALEHVRNYISEIVSQGKSILFVGTKRQAQDVIKEEAKRCGAYYINFRWLGGLLTNFQTIRKSVQRLKDIEEMEQDGRINKLTKKEISGIAKEKEKLMKNLSGILDMSKLPGVIFVVDPNKEETAVLEANILNIPVIALIDTNSDPDKITYPIPGNDDALKSIQAVTIFVSDCIVEARKSYNEVLRVLEEQKKIDAAVAEKEEDIAKDIEYLIEDIEEKEEKEKKEIIEPKVKARPKLKKE